MVYYNPERRINAEVKAHARRSNCSCCHVDADGRSKKYTLPKLASKLKTQKAKRSKPKAKNYRK